MLDFYNIMKVNGQQKDILGPIVFLQVKSSDIIHFHRFAINLERVSTFPSGLGDLILVNGKKILTSLRSPIPGKVKSRKPAFCPLPCNQVYETCPLYVTRQVSIPCTFVPVCKFPHLHNC